MRFSHKTEKKTFDSAVTYLRAHAFDVQQTPGVANRIQAHKHGCGAVLGRTSTGEVAYVSGPGCLIGGEIAVLVDRGYQKFLTTGRFRLPATADRLRALHIFSEELSEAAGTPDYYNQALGTVSDQYLYDRVKGREPGPEAAPEAH
ncbi:MAG: hypothetical protein ACYDC6_07360 [Acidobacteriaceae bacterium]